MGCLSLIPAALLSIFLTETVDRPEWRLPICAQIRAESAWNHLAESFFHRDYGNGPEPCCVGLGQVEKRTWAEWRPRIGCDGVDSRDPKCGIRFTVAYLEGLHVNYRCKTPDEPMEVAQACYNAGMGRIDKERRRCRLINGCDPDLWFDNLERPDVCQRSVSACNETRTYVRRIRSYQEM